MVEAQPRQQRRLALFFRDPDKGKIVLPRFPVVAVRGVQRLNDLFPYPGQALLGGVVEGLVCPGVLTLFAIRLQKLPNVLGSIKSNQWASPGADR